MTSGRLGGLDRLRGAALVMMLIHHLTDWFGGDARTVIPGWETFALTDVAAPAFTVTLGASVPLLLASRRERGVRGARLAGIVLRRYGLLVPIGVGLRWSLGFELEHAGVLETLGLCAVVVAVLVSLLPPAAVALLGVAVTAAAPAVERGAAERTDWLSTHMLTGTFPLAAYVGFALLGAAVVPALRLGPQRVPAAVLSAALAGWTLWLVMNGDVPDRYPGDVSFVVPGLAGTLLLYLAVSSPMLLDESSVGRLLGRAGAHTFGVFIGHYAVYAILRAAGLLHDLEEVVALPVAVAITVGIVLLAPRVPQPPWSPRTGWARPTDVPAGEAQITSRRG